ncbi:unnamed protein product [Heterobilharzia americana]|nr:unnamed protein product [Heterobilharzia americana]CAH8656980.1 unnamed protein product [Heterobilharzia americana]
MFYGINYVLYAISDRAKQKFAKFPIKISLRTKYYQVSSPSFLSQTPNQSSLSQFQQSVHNAEVMKQPSIINSSTFQSLTTYAEKQQDDKRNNRKVGIDLSTLPKA